MHSSVKLVKKSGINFHVQRCVSRVVFSINLLWSDTVGQADTAEHNVKKVKPMSGLLPGRLPARLVHPS